MIASLVWEGVARGFKCELILMHISDIILVFEILDTILTFIISTDIGPIFVDIND